MKLEFRQLCKIAVVIFLLYLAIHFRPALLSFAGTLLAAASPLFIGCIIAYVLNLLMNWYEKHWFPVSKKKIIVKTRRGVCLTAAILSLLLIAALTASMLSCGGEGGTADTSAGTDGADNITDAAVSCILEVRNIISDSILLSLNRTGLDLHLPDFQC